MARSWPRSMPQWQRSKPSTRRDGKCLPSIPSTPTSKRLRYCRYDDDFLIGIIGSKAEAREAMVSVERFLTETLKLAIPPEKSGIQVASKRVTFLVYRIAAYTSYGGGRRSNRKGPAARTWRITRRPTTGNISLRVPRKRIPYRDGRPAPSRQSVGSVSASA